MGRTWVALRRRDLSTGVRTYPGVLAGQSKVKRALRGRPTYAALRGRFFSIGQKPRPPLKRVDGSARPRRDRASEWRRDPAAGKRHTPGRPHGKPDMGATFPRNLAYLRLGWALATCRGQSLRRGDRPESSAHERLSLRPRPSRPARSAPTGSGLAAFPTPSLRPSIEHLALVTRCEAGTRAAARDRIDRQG